MQWVRYSHRAAEQVVPLGDIEDVECSIAGCSVSPSRGNAAVLRSAIMEELFLRGWPDRIAIASGTSKLSITSVRRRSGLCVQMGNFARTYADMLKLEALFQDGHLDCGLLIVPTGEAAREMGSNLARFDRVSRELPIFQAALECPILVYGVG